MKIVNAQVYTEDSGFVKKDVSFDEVFTACSKTDANSSDTAIEAGGRTNLPHYKSEECVIDAEGLYLVPGFIDIHTHGAYGIDSSDCDIEGLKKLAAFYASHGTTSFCATTMTLPTDKLEKAAVSVNQYISYASEKVCESSSDTVCESNSDIVCKGNPGTSGDSKSGISGNNKTIASCDNKIAASCEGLYLEGPFISEKKCGSQNPAYRQNPDFNLIKKIDSISGGKVKVCTVAPEQEGSEEFIRQASKLCTVSLAHTEADYDTALKAYKLGATQATHLFNAMPPFNHREPGIVGAAADSKAMAELICDGIHVHPSVVRAAFALFPDRIILISDSLSCTGMPDGTYSLGGQDIFLTDHKATLADGTLAGSVITLGEAVKNAVNFGIPLEAAVRAATVNPAKAIGAYGTIGCIKEGSRADMCLMDKNLDIVKVFVRGHEIKNSNL